jgi:GAF domain-containing protein
MDSFTLGSNATNERLIRSIADKMRRAPDMETLIQTTVREAAAALGTARAFLQLSAPAGLAGDEGKSDAPLASS